MAKTVKEHVLYIESLLEAILEKLNNTEQTLQNVSETCNNLPNNTGSNTIPQELSETIKNMKEKVELLYNVELGNWEIVNSQLIYYDENGNVIARFDLYDEVGNKTDTNVMKRVRVE